FSSCVGMPAVRSFPTRRSSDLPPPPRSRAPSPRRCPAICQKPTHWPTTSLRMRPKRPKPARHCVRQPSVCSNYWDNFVSADNLRSEEHTSELQSRENLVCRLLL